MGDDRPSAFLKRTGAHQLSPFDFFAQACHGRKMGLYPAWPDGRSRLLWGWTAAAGRPLLAGEGRLDGGGGGGEGGIALVGPLCQVLCLCQVASHLRAHPLLGSSLLVTPHSRKCTATCQMAVQILPLFPLTLTLGSGDPHLSLPVVSVSVSVSVSGRWH